MGTSKIEGFERPNVAQSVVMAFDPNSARSEAIRVLRAHIVSQHQSLGRRALAFCSPTANTGCTFVATNLATGLAQVGLSTIIIDGHLSASGTGFPFTFSSPVLGLSDYLIRDDLDLGQIMRPTGLDNLWVMTSGLRRVQTSESLGNERFKHLVMNCMRDFDITIINSPPADESADLRRIAAVAGYAVVVVRKDQSMLNDLKALTRDLDADRVNVIGVVINDF